MHVRDRPVLDRHRERLAVDVREDRPRAAPLAIDEAIRAVRVELQYPVPDDLKRDATDGCGLGAGGTVVDRGQCQQTPGLTGMLAGPGDGAEVRGTVIGRELDRHRDLRGEDPSNQKCPALGNTLRVSSNQAWY